MWYWKFNTARMIGLIMVLGMMCTQSLFAFNTENDSSYPCANFYCEEPVWPKDPQAIQAMLDLINRDLDAAADDGILLEVVYRDDLDQSSDTVTAYAMSDRIVLGSGIFRVVWSQDEAACVMAHERGHIVLNHMNEFHEFKNKYFQEKQKICPKHLSRCQEQSRDVFYAFRRDQENEADTYAVDLLGLAERNPAACLDFMRHLQRHKDKMGLAQDQGHELPLDRADLLEGIVDDWQSGDDE